ncbi:MAG: tail fiber assembly protein [Plesiomonas shigelloides]
MNLYMWSAKNNNFFPKSLLSDYHSQGWDISDCIDVPDRLHEEYSSFNPGYIRCVGGDGMPCWRETPPLSHDELVSNANYDKTMRIDSAKQHISLWQTQLQLGMISDADKAKLIEWMHYITALQAVDTSTAPDINWPPQPAE